MAASASSASSGASSRASSPASARVAPPVPATADATSIGATTAIVAAPPRLGPNEHIVVVNEEWLQQPLTKRATRRPSEAVAHRIAKTLGDNLAPIDVKCKLVIETAMRDPELWSMVRDIMNVNQQACQMKLARDRKRAEREAEEAAAARDAQAHHGRSCRARVLRTANTDEVREEHVSRNNRP